MIRGLKCYTNRIMRQLSSNISPTMSNSTKSYEEAVCTLNTLQSNAATVERIKEQKDVHRHVQMDETVQTAERAGVSLEMIDKLSVIHVSGTKGKGSTCAFSESILRNHGYKTGFFSSPHLVEVRERIRINGKPLSREAFSTYFWDCYQRLDETKADHDGDMPAYFRFLTVMAFHVFLQEKVDVAVMEVGIGGQYDSTNIVRSPVVCGITSLGLDHTNILGPTIEQIAWHKAGIFKPGVPAVTVEQPDVCLQVLKERAAEIGNPVFLTPSYSSYDWGGSEPAKLGIDGEMQKINASLALQLCQIWLQNHSLDKNERLGRYTAYSGDRIRSIEDAPKFKVTAQSTTGLESCKWTGRNQKVVHPGVTYYIDGAHTDSSIQQCVNWFLPEAKQEAKGKRSVARVLMFNLTGDRKPETLLRHLVDCEFDCAVFCPNIASVSKEADRADQRNFMVTVASQLSKCAKNRQAWLQLITEHKQMKAQEHNNNTPENVGGDKVNPVLSATGDCGILTGVNQQADTTTPQLTDRPHKNDCFTKNDTKRNSPNKASSEESWNQDYSILCNTIEEALQWINQGRRDPKFTEWEGSNLSPASEVLKGAEHIQVLCIGSLHLVGGLIGLLKPNINDS